jgi:surface carbohydrate biosynthesis protein
MGIRIGLLMNWKNRDLRTCVQLSVLLEKNGHTTKIIPHGPRTSPLSELRKFRPQIIVFPQVQGETKLVEYARKLKSRIIVLHTEGTWNAETAAAFYERGLRLYGDENPVELDLVWGRVMKDLLVDNTNLTEEMVKVIGCPRFDVYRPPLQRLMMSKKEFAHRYGLSKGKPLIVWATNFVNLDRTERDLKYQNEFVKRDILEDNDIQRSLRSKHLAALIQLIREYPNCDFAIKLHPLEVPDFYNSELKQHNLTGRVAIINDITIEHVLNSTDIFLNTNSTASTEAWFMVIPTVSLLFDERARRKLSAFAKGNEIVIDYPQLRTIVDTVLSGTYKPDQSLIDAREEFIENWFYKIDGQSTLRAAFEIERYIKQMSFDTEINPVYSNEVFQEQFSNTIIYRFARKMYHKVKSTTSYWDKIRESDKLHDGEIENLRDRVRKLYLEQES